MRRSKRPRYLNVRANHSAQKHKCVESFLRKGPMSCMPPTKVCMCLWVWLSIGHTSGTHTRLVKISTSLREKEIHERRRPILRVVRLINGLLREFAIYYLAARQQPANPTVSTRNEVKRWKKKKLSIIFSLVFYGLCSSHIHLRMKKCRLKVVLLAVACRCFAAHVRRRELQLWHQSNKVLHRIWNCLRAANRNETEQQQRAKKLNK